MKNLIEVALNSPKLYLVNCLAELRNQIDLDCEIYLSGKLETQNREKALQKQEEMTRITSAGNLVWSSDLYFGWTKT